MNGEQERRLARDAARAYREAARQVGPETAAALARARQRALSAGSTAGFLRRPGPAVATATAVAIGALALGLQLAREPEQAPVPVALAAAPEDVEILLAGEQLELLDELEFYLWLETEPDAG